MGLFLDSANVDDVMKSSSLGFVQGATTNPSLLIKAEHKDFYQALKFLCTRFRGPVFYQLTKHDLDGMEKEYSRFKGIAENIGFKIPCTINGLKFAAQISRHSVVAVTSVFNPSQAYLAAQAGAQYVIPYVNRATRFTGDGVNLLRSIVEVISTENCGVLAAGIKSAAEAVDSILAGCQHISVPYDVIIDMAENGLSQMAINDFDQIIVDAKGLHDVMG